jgi:hypothetical protein
MDKVSQASVNYRRGIGAQCAKCTMYTHGAGEGTFGGCTHVTGQITPYGVCNDYERMANPFGPLPQGHQIALHSYRLNRALNNP